MSDCLDHSIRFVGIVSTPEYILFLRIAYKSFFSNNLVLARYTSAAITPIYKDNEGVRYGIADEALRRASPISGGSKFFVGHKHRRLMKLLGYEKTKKSFCF